jgi:chemotaxis family two-component system response regulator PixG
MINVNDDNNSPLISIREFVASKQMALFHTLKQPQFSGELVLTDPKGIKSSFFIYMGRLMYGTKGVHPVRRWIRNIFLYAPKTSIEIEQLKKNGYTSKPQNLDVSWEYDILCYWVDQGKLSREQFTRVVKGILAEIFFDLTQVGQITYEFKEYRDLPVPLVLIDADTVIVEAWKNWQGWQGAKLADRSPNFAPIIRHPEQLKTKTSSKTYQTLLKLLSKQETLRDLATQIRPDLVQLTRLIMPYVQMGLIELGEIEDLPEPVELPKEYQLKQNLNRQTPVIVALDHSPLVLQTLETIITQAGYQFVGLTTPVKIIPILMEIKPDFIFLDIGLSEENAYDICTQLRKLSYFGDTPIVMLSDNGSFLERMRSKMVGASDLLLKPINDEQMLIMLKKYLASSTRSPML